MADTAPHDEVTQRTTGASLQGDEVAHFIDDPAGTPTSVGVSVDAIGERAFQSTKTVTADLTLNDSVNLTLGTGGDADVDYDGSDLKINPQVVGSGNVDIVAGDLDILAGDVIASGTILPAGDTAAADNAALGYTAAEGAILTGQGSTNDITIKNDADAAVVEIPTGTTNVDIVGVATASTFEPDGDTAAADNAAMGYTAAEGLILTGQGSTNDVTIKNDADADVIEIPTGTTNVDISAGNLDVLVGTVREAGVGISPIGVQDKWISVLDMVPSTTGGCAALAKLELATDQDIQTLDFDGAAIEAAQFEIALPKDWDAGTITATFYWSSTAADTDDVDWRLSGVTIGDNVLLTTAYGAAITVTDAHNGADNEVNISAATAAITIAGAGKSELGRFLLERDGASDTMSEDARLHGIMLHLTTDAATAA